MPRARVPDEDAVRFGAIVTRLRMERGWTLAALSRLSGLNATWLGVMERGGNIPSLATIFKLAGVFGVEAAELVREIEQSRRVDRAPASEQERLS
jgi:XRE family transcriptional regulator, regulator of sulfur utilization